LIKIQVKAFRLSFRNNRVLSGALRRIIPVWFLLVCWLAAGCEGIVLPESLGQILASPTAPAPTQSIELPTPSVQSPQVTVEPTPAGPKTLTIWVPPQFDPSSGTTAGNLFRARLNKFQTDNPDIIVMVRIKAASGPGGALEALAATSSAAPDNLPALVALTRSDLETAALKGLVYPLEGLSNEMTSSDWYDYSKQLGDIEGSSYGLPFAGDALVMLYRPGHGNPVPPTSWTDMQRQNQPVIFPAADSEALLTLTLYQSAGGAVDDGQRRPTLQPEILSKVLKLYSDGAKQGIFPYWLTQYQTDGQAWQAYRDQRAHWLISWCSHYLSELPADTTAAPLPSMSNKAMTLASGWVWAISAPAEDTRILAAHLGEYLVDGDFLAEWTSASGYLPTRPTALSAWPIPSQRNLISQVVLSAKIRPSEDLVSSLGPVIQDATIQVIKQQADPVQAAQAAAEHLTAPQKK
jgi:ABC-type glycerol-3-phosphate transport system substrate-binding protein